ncbi:2-hydroxyacid dehydrogenase [Larkinella bovis]|uniref:2-hydroxyacid dehydrogenase n=1 Tax=Larkinella bovis TaxID=683041 RepID=A0ABW0IJ81_9BACT
MKIAFFSTADYDRQWFESGKSHHTITFIEQPLTAQTAQLAAGHQAVCAFVHDDLGGSVLRLLKELGVGVIAMRCVGLDNVDQETASELELAVLTVPAYSPYPVAEQAAALLLALNRHLPAANQRVLAGDFTLNGLIGQDIHGKTVGIIGTGRIGRAFARIMLGFGCRILAYDLKPNLALVKAGVRFVRLNTLLEESDIVSLHCPLTPHTEFLINNQTLQSMKPTALLINTGRGKLVDTSAVLDALDQGQLAGYAADVYTRESAWFHRDFTDQPITDEVLNRLRFHPRVLLTAHQGFLTQEALQQIAATLLNQLSFYENSQLRHITRSSMC